MRFYGFSFVFVLRVLLTPHPNLLCNTPFPCRAYAIVQVTKRAVCTPDFEQLYRRADEISGGGGSGSHGGGLDGGLQGAGSGVDDPGGPVKMEVA